MLIEEKEYINILRKLPIVCVDVLILYSNQCLLLKRKKSPAKNEYWFPGGRIKKMETIQQAAIRKAKEETNLDCRFIKILTVEETLFEKKDDMEFDIHTINICCVVQSESINSLSIDTNHSDYIWVNSQNQKYHDAVNRPLSLLKIMGIEND
jgi:ADP-ribose pyrophosphatase YjhB (NUDIX family)